MLFENKVFRFLIGQCLIFAYGKGKNEDRKMKFLDHNKKML